MRKVYRKRLIPYAKYVVEANKTPPHVVSRIVVNQFQFFNNERFVNS